MNDTPPLDLDELRQLSEAATPGPWYAHNPDDDMCMNVHAVSTSPIEPDVGLDYRTNDHAKIIALTLFQSPRIVDHQAARWDADAAFIAAARTAVPVLLDRLAAVEQERNELIAAGGEIAYEKTHAMVQWRRRAQAAESERDTLAALLARYEAVEQERNDLRAHLAAIDAPETILYDDSHPNGLTPAMRALRTAIAERDTLAAQVQRLNQLLVDAWNDGEHANFCPIEFGEDICLCWRAEVDEYIQSLPKKATAAALGAAGETRP